MSQHIDPEVKQSFIVNDLTTNDAGKALSAAQGKALKDAADVINSNMTHYTKTDGTLTQYQHQDLDTLTTSGRYYIHSNCPNRPISNGGYLEVLSYNGDWFKQVYYSDNNNDTYIRTKHGSNTWTSWEKTIDRFIMQTRSTVGQNTVQLKSGSQYLVIADRYSVTESNYACMYYVDAYQGDKHITRLTSNTGVLSDISISSDALLSYTTGITYVRIIIIEVSYSN